MKIERTKNTIRNIGWGYIGKISNMLMPFILRTVMIYVLGSEYLGLNSLFTSVLQVLSLSELGFGTAMVYSMYKPIAEDDKESICALLKLYRTIYRYIGLVILAVGLLITPFIPKLITGSYPKDINIYIVYIVFLVNTAISYFLFAYKTSLLSAFQRNDLQSKTSTIVAIVGYSLQSLIVLLTKDYYFYLVIVVGTTVLNNVLNYIMVQKYFPEYYCKGEVSKEELQDIRKNVAALMCHKIGGTVLNSADNIVISAFLGLTMLAQYTNYYYIMNAVDSIVLICFAGMTAGIGNSFITESLKKNQANFSKILFFNGTIVGWFGCILACIFQDFITLWVGKKYLFNNSIMLLLIVYFFVHSIRRTMLSFRDATGMWWDNRFQPLVSASVNLVVNIILVQYIGIYGIVISTIVSMVFIDIPWESTVFCRQKLKSSAFHYYLSLIEYAGIMFLAICVSYLVIRYFHFALVINILLKILVSSLIFWVIFSIAFKKTENYKYFFKLLMRIVNVKK